MPRILIYLRMSLVSLLVLVFTCACSAEDGQSKFLSPTLDGDTTSPTAIVLEIEKTDAFQTPLDSTPTAIPAAGDLSKPEIILWHGLSDQDSLALGEIVANFQRENPHIKVHTDYFPYDDLQDRFTRAVNDGGGPDILLGAGEWGPELYDQGVVVNFPKGVLDELQLEISPPALEAVTYQDILIAMPYSLQGVVMFRNTAILSDGPKTFEELALSSQKVTKGRTIGAYLERGDLFAYAQLTACRGMLMFPNGYPAFNDSSGLCWLNLLNLFEAAGPISFNSDDDVNRFKAGNVGVIIAGTWNLATIKEALGDNLVIDPWPAFGESQLSGYVWTENTYLNANLAKDEYMRSLEFARYFLSPEGQSVFAELGQIPSTLYRDIKEQLLLQAVAALMGGTHYPVIPEMDHYIGPMHEVLLAVFDRDFSPSVALKLAEDEIMDLIQDFSEIEGNN